MTTELNQFIAHYQETIDSLAAAIDVQVEYEDIGHIPANDTVSLYFRQMASEPLLSAEQEQALGEIIQMGQTAEELLETEEPTMRQRRILSEAICAGEDARNQFVRANTRLVISIAKRYRNQDLPLEDLIQEGNVGLLTAVDKFDYTLGYRFSTYASWWIRQSITRALSQKSRTIRLPIHVSDQLRQIMKHKKRLKQELQHEPTWAEVAKDMNLKPEKVESLVTHDAPLMNLDAPVDEDGDTRLGELVPDESFEHLQDHTESVLLSEKFQKLLCEELPPRQAEVIRLRFGLNGARPQTLDQIASVMNLSRESIRTIQNRALRYLRQSSIAQHLQAFV